MIRIQLNKEEMEALQKLRLNRKSAIGERAYYVLLSAKGMSAPQIARCLSRNVITVRLWLNRYSEKGVPGLKTKKQSGRPPKKSQIIESCLEDLLSHSPSDYGYVEAGWQLNLLRDWFEKKKQCKVCSNTLVRALNNLGYVYKRFSKTPPKSELSSDQKKEAVSEMVEKIRDLSEENTEIFFQDESHFSNQPYVNRGWFKRGKKRGSAQKKSV